jgi:hypothetical protein
MLRYVAVAGSALLLVVAGFFAWQSMAQDEEKLVPPAPAERVAATPDAKAPPTPPSADERTKEQRRFDRADRDDDGRITLEELFFPRRAAFSRLDRNGDGQLQFEEWASRTQEKFAKANANRDDALSRDEFATTAVRRAPARANCSC